MLIDLVITTVDDYGNTINTICDDATVLIINLDDFPISFDLVVCPNSNITSDNDVSLDSDSKILVCYGRHRKRRRYVKPYQAPPPKIWKLRTNKHKSYCSCLSKFHFHDDKDSIPDLSDRFHTPLSFPLDDTNENLFPSQYDSVLQDDVNGELYFDALEDIDSDLDKHPGHFINVGDFTFSDNDPLLVYWDPDQGSADAHGERIYWHISGADVRVFVTASEDDGTLPHNHSFWVNYFHRKNISWHIYQGVLDYTAEIGINNMEVHEAMKPKAPCVTTPTKIDHESMQPYFAWMPIDRICKTFERAT